MTATRSTHPPSAPVMPAMIELPPTITIVLAINSDGTTELAAPVRASRSARR